MTVAFSETHAAQLTDFSCFASIRPRKQVILMSGVISEANSNPASSFPYSLIPVVKNAFEENGSQRYCSIGRRPTAALKLNKSSKTLKNFF
jgi:hypothetical protein